MTIFPVFARLPALNSMETQCGWLANGSPVR